MTVEQVEAMLLREAEEADLHIVEICEGLKRISYFGYEKALIDLRYWRIRLDVIKDLKMRIDCERQMEDRRARGLLV